MLDMQHNKMLEHGKHLKTPASCNRKHTTREDSREHYSRLKEPSSAVAEAHFCHEGVYRGLSSVVRSSDFQEKALPFKPPLISVSLIRHSTGEERRKGRNRFLFSL